MSAANDPARLDSINMIHDSALAAGEMLNRLLEFGRVGAQEQNESTTFPLAAVLEQAARRFAPVAARKGLHLHFGGGGDGDDGVAEAPASSGVAAAAAGVKLFTDRQKLERVLNNLIDNAIKYTRQGGVSVDAALHEETLAIRVADTGIGIPQQSVPYLFDEFYQVHNHARDPVQGFGIGLAICRCLARQLGGDVRLDHTGPEGSCFEIILHGVIHAGADRGGRPGGAAGDHADPLPTGLCHI
jgi:signal transduction histidine kinase